MVASASFRVPTQSASGHGATVRPGARFARLALALLGAVGANAAVFWSLSALNAGDATAAPATPAATRATFDLIEETPPVPELEPPPDEPVDESTPMQPAPIAPAPSPTPTPDLSLPLLTAVPVEGPRYASPPTPTPKPAKPRVLDAGQVEVPPRAVHMPDPPYPDALKRRRVAGKVTVRVLIDREGRVTRVALVDVVGHQSFGDAVERVAKAWRFEPARHHGRTVPVWARRTLQFNPSAR